MQLHVAQIVRFGGCVRILFGLDDGGRRRDARAEIMNEPIVAHSVTQQPAIRRKLRSGFILRRPRDLRQAACGSVAHENVAAANECRAPSRDIEDRRPIGIRHCLGINDLICAVLKIDTMQVDDRRCAAFDRVVRRTPVDGPVRVLHRRPDPIGVRHFFQRDLGLRYGRIAAGHARQRAHTGSQRHQTLINGRLLRVIRQRRDSIPYTSRPPLD